MNEDQARLLSTLIAHMDGQLKALQALCSTGQGRGHVLGTLHVWPPVANLIKMLEWWHGYDRQTLGSRISEAAQIIEHHWRLQGISVDGSVQQYNAVLTLALGPDAPQFYPSGDGWELRDVHND